MPRSNYSTVYPGSVQYWDGGTTTSYAVASAENSVENTSGVVRRKPTGWIPPTNYSLLFRQVRTALGFCASAYIPAPSLNQQSWTGYVGGLSGNSAFNSLNHFNEILLESDVKDSNLANAALIGARLNLKSKKVDLGVAFGERKQTARLVGDTASRIGRSIMALKRGSPRKAMDIIGISRKHKAPSSLKYSNQWLELQYGWKPLLSDIHGACDALSKRNKSDWNVTAKATRKKPIDISKSAVGTIGRYVGGAKGMHSVLVRIDAQPQNEALISLSSVGITNPLVVAWELVPWSFVVDWFVPVGSYLDSLDALLGFGPCFTSTSSFVKVKWTGKGQSVTIGNFSYTNQFSESKLWVELVRSAQAGVPLPSFPSIKDPRSLGHMANGIALLGGVFGRLLHKRP